MCVANAETADDVCASIMMNSNITLCEEYMTYGLIEQLINIKCLSGLFACIKSVVLRTKKNN